MLHKDIVEHNMPAFVQELVEATLDGWKVSPTCPGDALVNFGSTFTVSLYRDESTIADLRKLAGEIKEKPKLTREEILANARDAKRVKATAALDVKKVVQ